MAQSTSSSADCNIDNNTVIELSQELATTTVTDSNIGTMSNEVASPNVNWSGTLTERLVLIMDTLHDADPVGGIAAGTKGIGVH